MPSKFDLNFGTKIQTYFWVNGELHNPIQIIVGLMKQSMWYIRGILYSHQLRWFSARS